MTTANEAKEAVYARVVASFSAVPANRYYLDGEQFTKPRPSDANPNWVRFAIRTNTRQQITLGKTGNRKYESRATLFANIFTPPDAGSKAGDDIGAAVLALFEGVGFSDLDFMDGIVRELGTNEGWQQHTATVNFMFEEIK